MIPTRSRSPVGRASSRCSTSGWRARRRSSTWAAIDELAGIRSEDGTLVVGAMTRQWDLEHSDEAHPLLREALAFVGHTATRCRGTVGGSLVHADPTAELPVCALALGAELVVAGPGGRRTISAEEFFVTVFTTALEPGELLVEVRFPAPGGGWAFEEHAHRHGDFAVVCVAVAGERVALGGVGATPVLWDGVDLDPVGDLFAPAGYKQEVARALIARAGERAAA